MHGAQDQPARPTGQKKREALKRIPQCLHKGNQPGPLDFSASAEAGSEPPESARARVPAIGRTGVERRHFLGYIRRLTFGALNFIKTGRVSENGKDGPAVFTLVFIHRHSAYLPESNVQYC